MYWEYFIQQNYMKKIYLIHIYQVQIFYIYKNRIENKVTFYFLYFASRRYHVTVLEKSSQKRELKSIMLY